MVPRRSRRKGARKQDLQKYVGRSLADIGLDEGKHPGEVMLDLSLATDLKAEFLGPDKGSNAEFMAELMDAPYTLPGVSDGGAHTKFFTGGAWPTDMLKWLVRDEGKVTLEEAHFRLSALPVHAAGFRDRGVLREGAAADVVVRTEELTWNRWTARSPTRPVASGAMQRARLLIINGHRPSPTGIAPGRHRGLLRHGRLTAGASAAPRTRHCCSLVMAAAGLSAALPRRRTRRR